MKRLQFFKSTGDELAPDANMAVATYYAEFVAGNGPLVASCHLIFDATVVATATFESSNDRDVSVYATVTAGADTGRWVDEAAIADVVINASAGGNMMQHSGWAAARGRVKVVVTTGGRLYGWSGRV